MTKYEFFSQGEYTIQYIYNVQKVYLFSCKEKIICYYVPFTQLTSLFAIFAKVICFSIGAISREHQRLFIGQNLLNFIVLYYNVSKLK